MSGNSCGYDTVYRTYYDQNRTLHPRSGKKPQEVALNTLQSIPGARPSPESVALVSEFGESSVNLILRFWSDPTQQDANRITSIVPARTKEAFGKMGITIPFPIRPLHLPNGANGANDAGKDR
jgi:small conductance mechanosensitive channel